MSKKITIAIDAMGGENSPDKTIEGVKIFIDKNKSNDDFILNIFGIKDIIDNKIRKYKFTGKKFTNKKYYRHTGHPGGIKVSTPYLLKEKSKTEEILKLAVKRMLPGGPLAKKQLTKLKIYNGEKHPHDVQQPKIIEFEKLNKRNIIK